MSCPIPRWRYSRSEGIQQMGIELVKCPACGAECSSAAAQCQKCGHPFRAPGACKECGSTKVTKWKKDSGLGCLVALIGLLLAIPTFGISLLLFLATIPMQKKGKKCLKCGHTWLIES